VHAYFLSHLVYYFAVTLICAINCRQRCMRCELHCTRCEAVVVNLLAFCAFFSWN